MGRFTDYISNATQRFRDPGQILDAFLPGDIRQDGRWVPSGIAAGVGQVASGGVLPAALTQPLIGRIGSMLSGGRPEPGNAGMGPTMALPTTGGSGFLQGGFGSNGPGRDPDFRMQGVTDFGGNPAYRAQVDAENARIVDQVRGTVTDPGSFNGPRLSRGESGGGGNMGGVTLGLGQLGRGGDESLAAFAASLFTRGGTQAEQ